jgi:hypothetical protein
MTDPILEKLFDVIDESRLSPQQFFRVGFAFFATAISTLPPAEREAQLRAFLTDDSLRQAVEKFPINAVSAPMH